MGHGGHRAAALLRQESDDARNQRQPEEWRLFQNELPPQSQPAAAPGFRTPHSAFRTSPKRPEVEQQQQERQSDQHRFGEQTQNESQERERVALPARAFGIESIGQQGEEAEERAQDILPFGHPGHRLHMKRVPGKQRCHQGAGPERAGHPAQERKQHQRVRQVQEYVGQVMPSGGQPV